ncbi:GNAT superfamily N-acetyltransferase [Neorhizobium galegae]|uniref:GNAT family N-acetyltransferase n=1 Tax=Neorhizobium galegae TaxID=399 RepID=UPI001AE8FDC2|nr:GNAT family N-acetyltransferase [Neorhizobium galegae]MBP2550929.1 GNAT superfamily N-acetyltransferase [Neorhizobium galegae]
MHILVTDTASAEDVAAIGSQLSAFNEQDVGPADRRALSVLVKAPDGTLAAGLNGYTAWGWLYVQWLWVGESLRGQGLAGQMLQAAEDEARARGCGAAFIDTFNPAAKKAYRRQGYEVFGELANFPAGRRRTFLQKRL